MMASYQIFVLTAWVYYNPPYTQSNFGIPWICVSLGKNGFLNHPKQSQPKCPQNATGMTTTYICATGHEGIGHRSLSWLWFCQCLGRRWGDPVGGRWFGGVAMIYVYKLKLSKISWSIQRINIGLNMLKHPKTETSTFDVFTRLWGSRECSYGHQKDAGLQDLGDSWAAAERTAGSMVVSWFT